MYFQSVFTFFSDILLHFLHLKAKLTDELFVPEVAIYKTNVPVPYSGFDD